MKRMKENFDSKEHLLLEERDKATEAHKYETISSRIIKFNAYITREVVKLNLNACFKLLSQFFYLMKIVIVFDWFRSGACYYKSFLKSR